VPYTGAGPEVIALVGGEVQMAFNSPIEVASHLKTGRLKALAVTSAQPSALLPDLPTVSAAGVPGYESVAMIGIFAPAKTPENTINRLNEEIVRLVKSTQIKGKFLELGAEAIGTSQSDFATKIKYEIARTRKLIKDAGIKAD
jgi:tripartite-type tricarboxylate transporter receptor subunit TctC